MEKKSISLNNKETYAFIEHGSSDKVLILLHGNLSSSLFYKSILKEFDDYRVIASDMRGFGDSSYIEPIETMEDLADDLNLFIERMGLTKVSILGWSAGGAVAMKFASKYPDKTEKLILMASASYRGYPIFKKDELNQPKIGEYYSSKKSMAKDPVNVVPVSYLLQNKDTETAKKLYDMVIFNITKPTDFEYKVLMKETVKQRNIVDFDWALTSFNMSNFTNGVTLGDDSIKNVKCPVLSLYGQYDLTVLEYMIDETVEALDNVKKVVFENSGHAIFFDEKEKFLEEVKGFLKM